MATARVFKSGNSQAVRLPKKFRLRASEVEIFRRGDEIVLKERAKGMASAFHLLAGLPDDASFRVRDTMIRRRSAKACRDGHTLPARYQHLHLHPPETPA